MSLKKIVFDLETQKSFDEVGGRGRNDLLKISVLGLYNYHTDRYECYTEEEIYKVGELFQEADQIIGFNIKGFDFHVLQPYLNYNVHELPYLDIMEEVEKILGHRLKLDNLATTTLGVGKNGDGLEALRMWKQGRVDELKKYCTQDVKVTKELYDYVMKHKKLFYKDYFERREMQIAFAEPVVRKPVARQTALF